MNANNWEKIKYLPISSFILLSVVFFINLYFFVKLILDLKQLMKFKQQDVVYYQNNQKLIFLKIIFGALVGFYLFNLVFFITYLVLFWQPLNNPLLIIYYFNEIFLVFFLTLAIYFLIWMKNNSDSLIIAIKNQKLILLNETIILEDVIKVFHDEKRKYIYIRWKDREVKGNTGQIKIRYHYQIKDLLIASHLPTFFD